MVIINNTKIRDNPALLVYGETFAEVKLDLNLRITFAQLHDLHRFVPHDRLPVSVVGSRFRCSLFAVAIILSSDAIELW